MTTSVVAVVSGGLDSTTLLYELVRSWGTVHAVSFDYGQRHGVELDYASASCNQLGVRHDVIDLSGLASLIGTSSLTGDEPVPEGHYAQDTMKATVVPNRNMVMIAVAGAVAVSERADALAVGVHTGDHFVYPDCRPVFIAAANEALRVGNDNPPHLIAPYLSWSKADIAYRALELGVPLEDTWSCYVGGTEHCGRCGTCVERLEAIDAALGRFPEGDTPGDPTPYADSTFWREACQTPGMA